MGWGEGILLRGAYKAGASQDWLADLWLWLCAHTALPRPHRRGTLDYIFYTTPSLQPTAILELPTDAEVQSRPDEPLPNAQYSSDHLCIMAEFQIQGRA